MFTMADGILAEVTVVAIHATEDVMPVEGIVIMTRLNAISMTVTVVAIVATVAVTHVLMRAIQYAPEIIAMVRKGLGAEK